MILKTTRTTITPLAESDIPEMMEMYREPDSNKFIPPLFDKDDDYYNDFLSTKIENNKSDVGFWTVRDLTQNTFIGTVNLNQFADTNMIHIGCHLKRDFWNQGYAYELMSRLRDHGIEDKQLSAIHGIFNEEHIVSAKLLKKLKFTFFESRIENEKQLNIYRYTP